MGIPEQHYRSGSTVLACLLIFALALCRYWVHDRTEAVRHDPESFRLARSIVEKGDFANPFVALDTGPSAHMGPVFPAFLALLIRLFGDGTGGMYAIKLSAAIVLSLQLALFPLFSRTLGMGALNGVIAACIWIASKTGYSYGWEAVYAAILLAGAVCLFRRCLDLPKSGSKKLYCLLGCVMGILMLTSPTASVILIGFVGLLLWRYRLSVLRRSHVLLIILLPVLIATPWTVRNFLVFHHLIFVRDNFGLELAVSNNDYADFGEEQNFRSGAFVKLHPNRSLVEAEKVLAYGEVNYNQSKLHEALNWIETHPKKFMSLSWMRFVAFWKPP
ncbi:MAG: glycosyltransferase family 39 protein, partial [Verrucomicrobia bacterium]|nr:glycosyltransferase family 39 protein [Verrucomicrobiota bacterium]